MRSIGDGLLLLTWTWRTTGGSHSGWIGATGWMLLIAACVIAILSASLSAADPPNRVLALIRDLGAAEFQTRQRATQELAGLGATAYSEVVKATSHDDPEVRQRANYIASMIESSRQREQLRRLRIGEPLTEHDLPGWDLYVSIAGDSPDSREFYAAVLEEEWRLMSAVLKEPESANEIVLRRNARMTVPRVEGEGTDGTALIAAVLLLNCHEQIQLSYLSLEKVMGQIQSAGYRGGSRFQLPLRSILAKSLTRAHDRQTTFEFLRVGTNLGLPETLELAKQVLMPTPAPGAERPDPILLSNAMMAVRKLGNAEHVVWLEPYFNDARAHLSMRATTVQVRDEALVTARQILQPKGTNPAELAGSDSFDLPFPDDAARERALRELKEILASRNAETKPATDKP